MLNLAVDQIFYQRSQNPYFFPYVVWTCNPHYVKNAGFYKDNLTVKTYVQTKKGLGYFYAKRKVQPDGITTEPLDI